MNYKKIYNQIIEKRQKEPINNGYSEKHHILPKSLGGSNNQENLVRLTAREHFICHYLLIKINTKTENKYKMIKAFSMMNLSNSIQQRYMNSRLYESQKKLFSEAQSQAQKGKGNSQFGTCWVCNLEPLSKKIKKNNIKSHIRTHLSKI